ncbi:SH3 domain-containing protein [Clostridium perfringens]|uniref:SH3 domain-containing protein n=1 Tax=Clostridium perfringens TaxID=1502 RepID=UPI002AC5B2EF|nr:SH3 domain-containing protein [Clostridium perfringens]MDZ4972762.1 SH3 domain-containing protein [Clostridium perfringens]
MANNIIPNVSSGDLVGSTPTFPPNAVVRGDFLYLRDVDGNQIPGRTVSDGDEITVLFISNEKNIVLVQYPTSSGYRQGYVTNARSIIKYKDDYSWVNGSTPEPVYDFDKTTQIGTLDPRERAVVLYKVDGMTYVAYDTGKGKLTKSGLVHYEGSGSSTGGGSFNGVAPGEVVPGGFTYENNAEVVGDELYLRDANGNLIPGRSVSVGDKITVLDVSYSKQLALVQYPAGNVVRQGYVTNATNLIRYFNQSMWHNGSTPEEVLDENGGHLGSLDPYESATPLYKKNGMTHVVYNTSKGPNTKSGYVKYEGSAATRVDIPSPSITNVQKIVYGTSGRGRELAAYKVGNGANSLIYVCAIHGWEDHWAADGIELTRIGNGLIEHFQNAGTNNWSLYIIPVANPDGLSEGYTNNGPGRCTIVGAVDCNRDFPIGFTPYGDSRHWTNKEPLSVPESRSLRDFISGIKGKTSGSTYLIDMHGWEDKTIGDSHISRAFQNQFGFVNGCYDGVYQGGFLISWANSIGVRAALIELPQSCYSHSDAVNGRYLQKAINAVTNLIGGSGGSSSGGSTGGNTGSGSTGGSSSSDVTYIANGEVINVQSFLNVRKGPGTNYDSIGQLNQGDNVSIVAKNGEWYKISSPIAGYVHSDFIRISSNDNNDKHMEAVNKRVEDILSIFKNNLLGAKYKLAFNKYMRLYKGESFNVDFRYGVGLEFNEDALITMDFSDGKIVSENIFVQSLIDFIYVIDKKFDKMSIFIKEFEKIVKNCKITIEGNLAEAAVTVTLEVKIDENKAFSTENSIFFDFKISFDILDFIKKMLDKFGDKIADIAGKIWGVIKNIGNKFQQMIGFVAFIVVALIISAGKLTEEVVSGILAALLGFITNLA